MSEPVYEVVIQESHLYELQDHLLGDPRTEYAAYLLCGRSVHPRKVKLLVQEIIKLRAEDFITQRSDRLQISPETVARVMKRARLNNQSIVLTHSHPFCRDEVDFSWVDDQGDIESFNNFYQRVPEGPHASLVFGQRVVCGRVWLPDAVMHQLAHITLIGSTISKIPANGRQAQHALYHQETHDRQVQAFGADGQKRIAETVVAVVGAGGTGSVVIDQLIRLGVQRLIVVDDDHVEASNTSRIYNSTLEDITSRRAKVEIVERLANSVGFGTEVSTIKGNIISEAIALELRQADVIFCCTDNQWSRAILNQFVYQYLTPVIDMGNRIDSRNGHITAANGRVYLILPKQACLWCYGVLDGKRIAEESLPREERGKLAQEGYVTGADISAPSVIFLNTVVAGLAVAEFVNLVTNYMGRSYHPQLTYHPVTGEVKSTVYEANPSCACTTGKHTAQGDKLRLPCR
ncbi:MAG: ThiF family adenylyltransferase [Bdellovibrionota bacterium]